jgi:hypothetical protein
VGKRKVDKNNEKATFDDFFNDVEKGLSSEDLGNSVDGWAEDFNKAIFGDSDDEEDTEESTEMELDLDALEDDEDEEEDYDETDFEDEEPDNDYDEMDFEDADALDAEEEELDDEDGCHCGCGNCNCCDDDEDDDDEELEDYGYLGMYLNVLECLSEKGIPVDKAIEYLKDSDLCYEAALDSVQMLMNKLEPVDIIKVAMGGLV